MALVLLQDLIYLIPAAAVALTVLAAFRCLRECARDLDGAPAPYGVGPTGIARITYPSLAGMTATERFQ